MLEGSFGLVFFMKITSNDRKIRTVYFRITVDGITKEASTKRKWEHSQVGSKNRKGSRIQRRCKVFKLLFGLTYFKN
jgi:hypothetical protein